MSTFEAIPEDEVSSVFGYSDTLLRPYMGLLPVEQPDDPWRQKAYNPHRPLYSGGGSYEAYLRPRRDTHIMAQSHPLSPGMLTPGMLERLLKIKAEFQRRFPHLYQNMLNHHTNRTRVSVKPPLLVRLNNNHGRKDQKESKELKEEAPVYELGAAELGLLDVPSAELTTEKIDVTSLEQDNQDNKRHKDEKEDDDDDLDFFRFDDEDTDDNDHYNVNSNNDDNDADLLDD